MSGKEPETLDYAPGKPLPWWAHLVAAAFWVMVYLGVYSMAIAAPVFVIVGIVELFHPLPGAKAFGEPIQTTWQKFRLVAWPSLLSVIFIPLAVWLHKQGREKVNRSR